MHRLRLIGSLSARPIPGSKLALTTKRPAILCTPEYTTTCIAANDERQALLDTFPQFLDIAIECNYGHVGDLQKIANHMRRMMSYTLTRGTLYSAQLTMGATTRLDRSYGSMAERKRHLQLSTILSWLSQMDTVYVLMADDIMDNAIRRYSIAPWFKKDGVGLSAINDAFLMVYAIGNILRAHFSREPYYLELIDSFTTSGFLVHAGQALDMNVGRLPLMDTLTMSEYENIVKYKTCWFISGPIKRGLIMNGFGDIYEENAAQIAIKLGRWKQLLNDRMDCFPQEAGLDATCLTGTDIEEGRSTWYAAKTLQLANAHQMEIFQENYGKKDAECVQRVKDLYVALGLRELCQMTIDNMIEDVHALIGTTTWKLPRDYSLFLIGKIF